MVGQIQLQIADAEHIRFLLLGPHGQGAPLQCPQPGQQFLNGERFDQVVIDAGIEGFHLVLDLVVAGEH